MVSKEMSRNSIKDLQSLQTKDIQKWILLRRRGASTSGFFWYGTNIIPFPRPILYICPFQKKSAEPPRRSISNCRTRGLNWRTQPDEDKNVYNNELGYSGFFFKKYFKSHVVSSIFLSKLIPISPSDMCGRCAWCSWCAWDTYIITNTHAFCGWLLFILVRFPHKLVSPRFSIVHFHRLRYFQ